MPLTKLSHLATSHLDAGVGGVLGLVSSLGITTGVTPVPEGVPTWVGYLASLGIALAPMAISALRRWYRGEAAGDRVRAAKLRARADKLRAAGQVADADKRDEQADELDAEAAEKEAKARGGVE